MYFTTNLTGIIKDKSNSSTSKLFMHNAGLKLNLRVYMRVSECVCVASATRKKGALSSLPHLLHDVYLQIRDKSF